MSREGTDRHELHLAPFKSRRRGQLIILRVLALAFIVSQVYGIDVARSESPDGLSTSQEQLRLQRERLDFDKDNATAQGRLEVIKALITALSLVVPILLALYTVRSQVRSNIELKRLEADRAFELKAAEIVMDARNPFGVRQKARVLRALFPDRLAPRFVESFDPKTYATVGPSTESKMELLRLLVANPDKEAEIVTLWVRMFPGDKLEQLFPGDHGASGAPRKA